MARPVLPKRSWRRRSAKPLKEAALLPSPATIILMFSCGVYAWVFFLRPLPQGSPSDTRPGNTAPIEIVDNEKCERLLDRFDRTFDERRVARGEKLRAWLDKQAKRRVKRKVPQRAWFHFDTESDCFTNQREFVENHFSPQTIHKVYDTFHDGPKFLCGIDLIPNTKENCLVYKVGQVHSLVKSPLDKTVKAFLSDCDTQTFNPNPPSSGNDGVGYDFRKYTRLLGRKGRTIDVIYIDCKNCEGLVLLPLLDAIAAGELRVNQIHTTVTPKWPDTHGGYGATTKLFSAVDKAGFRILDMQRISNDEIHYVFVNQDFLRRANKQSLCRS